MSLISLPAMHKTVPLFNFHDLDGVPRGPCTLTILDLMCTLTIPLLALSFPSPSNMYVALCSSYSAPPSSVDFLFFADKIM